MGKLFVGKTLNINSKRNINKHTMKLTLHIRQLLKQRKHMSQLVAELEKDIQEAIRIKERYKKTLDNLNSELSEWDEFSSKLNLK
jgi:DNA polymerase III alpha subunit